MILAIYIYKYTYKCRNHANYGKTMKKNEYFSEITEKVKERRIKDEHFIKQSEIFRKGKQAAFTSILIFLHPSNSDIYDKYTYSESELQDFVEKEISSLRDRLEKARLIYLQNQRIIKQMSQLTID